MQAEQLKEVAIAAIEDVKGLDICAIDVNGISSFTDIMVIATGTSDRHLRAMSDSVQDAARKAGHKALGVEGEGDADWVLVDLGDVVVHVMRQLARDRYQLEKLWSTPEPGEAVQENA